MFGYVRPDVGRLTVNDYGYYRAAYCGVCRELGRICGPASRLCLSYDVVFLEMLTLRLGGGSPTPVRAACPVNPFLRRDVIIGTGESASAAAVCGLLAHFRFADDARDESGFRRVAASAGKRLSSRWAKRADTICPGHPEEVREKLLLLADAEEAAASGGECSLDGLSGLFGDLLGTVCAYPFIGSGGETKSEAAVAFAVGRKVGRWIYVADALDDLASDEKKGRFNPVLKLYGRSELTEEEKKTLSCLAAAEAGEALDDLSLISEKEGSAPQAGRIIENVLGYGIPAVTADVLSGGYRKPRRDGL